MSLLRINTDLPDAPRQTRALPPLASKGPRRMHHIRRLALALVVTATPAMAEMNPTLERALKACLSQDMSAEARFKQLEAEGWQFLRDTPEAREFTALQNLFFQQAWGVMLNWREDADSVKASFAQRMAKPHREVEYQTERYGDTFSATAVMAEVTYMAGATLQHPDIAGVLNAHITLPNDGEPQFDCNFDLADLPAPDAFAALLPATATRKDYTNLPGMFVASATADGQATLTVFFSPMTGLADYDEMLNVLGAKHSYDGSISTIVKPVKERDP
jgi:hypothetical protein